MNTTKILAELAVKLANGDYTESEVRDLVGETNMIKVFDLVDSAKFGKAAGKESAEKLKKIFVT